MHRHQELKVAFLTRYDRSRGSSRVRVYDYLPYLAQRGWHIRVYPFPDRLTNWAKVSYTIRALQLARWADVLVLQKLLLQERFIRLLFRINHKVVFDFDDAIYAAPSFLEQTPRLVAFYERLQDRLDYLLRKAAWVIVGSEYLARYARQRHARVEVIPSSVDMKRYPLKPMEATHHGPVVLGWIGSPEVLGDLKEIEAPLREIAQRLEGRITLKVVSSQMPRLDKRIPLRFQPWELDRDAEFLHSFDIGLMPLADNERNRGRCAFKAIQYMAVGLPVVASPVGAALEVIEPGKSGFLPRSPEEWVASLMQLHEDVRLRRKMGLAARKRIAEHYSIQVHAPRLDALLRRVIEL